MRRVSYIDALILGCLYNYILSGYNAMYIVIITNKAGLYASCRTGAIRRPNVMMNFCRRAVCPCLCANRQARREEGDQNERRNPRRRRVAMAEWVRRGVFVVVEAAYPGTPPNLRGALFPLFAQGSG
jgi:hypothetical protein